MERAVHHRGTGRDRRIGPPPRQTHRRPRARHPGHRAGGRGRFRLHRARLLRWRGRDHLLRPRHRRRDRTQGDLRGSGQSALVPCRRGRNRNAPRQSPLRPRGKSGRRARHRRRRAAQLVPRRVGADGRLGIARGGSAGRGHVSRRCGRRAGGRYGRVGAGVRRRRPRRSREPDRTY